MHAVRVGEQELVLPHLLQFPISIPSAPVLLFGYLDGVEAAVLEVSRSDHRTEVAGTHDAFDTEGLGIDEYVFKHSYSAAEGTAGEFPHLLEV